MDDLRDLGYKALSSMQRMEEERRTQKELPKNKARR
jgi:hypothetical protein